MLAIVGLIVIVANGPSTPREPPPPPKTKQELADDAAAKAAANEHTSVAYACERAITAGLNDPDSADFPGADEVSVESTAKDLWEVSFLGRAKNGFGAVMLGRGTCEVMRFGPDDYRAVNASMK